MINSKWLMIMDFARIEKEYGSLEIRVLDHVTYMYFLAFFIDKGNPKKKGMIDYDSLPTSIISTFLQKDLTHLLDGSVMEVSLIILCFKYVMTNYCNWSLVINS